MLHWLYDLLLNQDKKNKKYQTIIKTMECNGFKQEQIQKLNWKILKHMQIETEEYDNGDGNSGEKNMGNFHFW